MNKETFSLMSVQQKKIMGRIWIPDGEPRAVIQFVHGMAEHIDRYDGPAAALCSAGFAVYGHNHLGHGPGTDLKGFFGEQDGWQSLVEDVHAVSGIARQNHPGLPYFLLGHSMGSFVVRCYMTEYAAGLSGVILSGTGYYPKSTVMAGKLLADLVCLKGKGKKPSPLINRIAFSANNKPFTPGRTPFDWLSRDEAEVDRYIADPLCGFLFTASGYRDLFTGLEQLTDLKRLSSVPAGLPVLFISGSMDPVGQMGKGPQKIAEQLRRAGVQDVTLNIYPNARHELFNEKNREEVYQDLVSWMEKHIRRNE